MSASLVKEIREYLAVAETWLRIGVEDGSITIEEAKQHAAEMAKWEERAEKIEKEIAA